MLYLIFPRDKSKHKTDVENNLNNNLPNGLVVVSSDEHITRVRMC